MYADVFRGKGASCRELTLKKKKKDYYFVYIYVEGNNKANIEKC